MAAESTSCPGCGNSLVPPLISGSGADPSRDSSLALNGRKATFILFAFLAAQFAFAAFVSTIILVLGGDLRATREVLAPAMLFGFLGGGLVMILLSRYLVLESLADRSVFGAAWVLGTRKARLQGFVLGAAFALGYLLLTVVLRPQVDEN